jgi:hypothetical protein
MHEESCECGTDSSKAMCEWLRECQCQCQWEKHAAVFFGSSRATARTEPRATSLAQNRVGARPLALALALTLTLHDLA